jgi:hypothetical protein
MRNIKAELLQDGATEQQAEKIANEVMTTLAVYGQTTIWYEHGRYDSTPHAILTATYAADRRMITRVKDTEVYTPEQLKANLAELNKANWMD